MKNLFYVSMLLISSFILLTACNCKEDINDQPPGGACAQAGDSLIIYSNSNAISPFWSPGGWMPDGKGIVYLDDSNEVPHSAPECIKIKVTAGDLTVGWAGVYWLANDSWNGPGINIAEKIHLCDTQSAKVVFWARGASGAERIQFLIGGVTDGNDSIDPAKKTQWIQCSADWAQYEIDLTGMDLSNVVGGFGWATAKDKNPGKSEIVFFLDDIKYVVQ